MSRAVIAGLALVAAAPADREALGLYDRWAAFRDADPRRCYAIAAPVAPSPGARTRAFAAIGTWTQARASGPGRGQFYARLSRPRDPHARVTLSIGERRFDLIGRGLDAWAPDTRADTAIIAAIRTSRSMSLETLGRDGPFADTYALKGAASAIDAAAIGCVGR